MNIQRLAQEIRIVSIVSFCVQLALGVIPAIWLFVALINRSVNSGAIANTAGSWGLGVLSLIALLFSIVWWFFQWKLAKILPDVHRRPPRAKAVQSFQTGLVVNLGGMVLVVLAAIGYAWFLFVKVVGTPRGSITIQPNALVPTPVFTQLNAITILAIVHTIAALLVGVAGYSWLLYRVRSYQPGNRKPHSDELYPDEVVQ
jgi:hypothetical protein